MSTADNDFIEEVLITNSDDLKIDMDRFADDHGDQELIKVMEAWLNTRMGGTWSIINKEEE